jgi:Fic family protein
MASKLNTEFNYRYQVNGETPWEKIKILQGFLEGRIRAAALEEVSELKLEAKRSELKHLKEINALPHIILNLRAEILEYESGLPAQIEAFQLNQVEIKILKKVLAECFEIAEPTRMKHPDGTPYTNEEMYEANAANEFTVMIGKEIHAEILANGRPSPAKLRNAMSNPHTWNALQQIGLIPENAQVLIGSADPLKIEFTVPLVAQQQLENN